jgi:transposase
MVNERLAKQREERMKSIRDMFSNGSSPTTIAKEMKISDATVYYYLHKGKLLGKRKLKSKHVGRKGNGQHRKSKKISGKVDRVQAAFEITAAYTAGRVEQFIRGHAESVGISFSSLAGRVASALSSAADRELIWSKN